MPPHIAAWIKGKGKAFDAGIVEAQRDLYVALHRQLPRPTLEFHADLAYGPDACHLLDLHLPPARGAAALPVVMYFHGGGFVGGEKNPAGRLLYGNVADYFAANGIIGINATYRLAPGAQWPEAARDVGLAPDAGPARVGSRGQLVAGSIDGRHRG